MQSKRASAGFTLVELMVVVAILGILAAIAIPTVGLYARRTKTAEARVQIAKMFDSSTSFFNTDRVERGDVDELGAGAGLAAGATHRCPHPPSTPTGGAAGMTPPFAVDCNDGPGGRCVPRVGGTAGGYYDISLWGSPMWDALNFSIETGHFFHYEYVATNSNIGYGDCQFTAQAFGDLDGDGTYSTFERMGAADVYGVNAAAGLYIDLVVE